MRCLENDVFDYDAYLDLLNDGEMAYCITYGSTDECCVIRERDEEYVDFIYDVKRALRRKHGHEVRLRAITDITDGFGDE